jgi:hypothetical protein
LQLTDRIRPHPAALQFSDHWPPLAILSIDIDWARCGLALTYQRLKARFN